MELNIKRWICLKNVNICVNTHEVDIKVPQVKGYIYFTTLECILGDSTRFWYTTFDTRKEV